MTAEGMGQMGEQPRRPEAGHHRHKAVQEGQGAEIEIGKIRPVEDNEKTADPRRKGGRSQHRFPFDKSKDLLHGKAS